MNTASTLNLILFLHHMIQMNVKIMSKDKCHIFYYSVMLNYIFHFGIHENRENHIHQGTPIRDIWFGVCVTHILGISSHLERQDA
jgi:hypothetical protein